MWEQTQYARGHLHPQDAFETPGPEVPLAPPTMLAVSTLLLGYTGRKISRPLCTLEWRFKRGEELGRLLAGSRSGCRSLEMRCMTLRH